MYEIEKSVPVPPKDKSHAGRPAKYPFAQMAVGDSVEVPAKARTAVHAYATRTGKRFITRRASDTTIRVWRVEPAPRSKTDRRLKYPFAQMEVGDSVELPGTRLSPRSSKAYGAAMRYGSRAGKRFEARRETDTTIRIWRTA